MAFLQLLGLKKAPSAKELRDMLPAIHSFVDVAVKNGPKGSLCFESAGSKTFLTTTLPGLAAGQTVVFSYTNAHGRYRFTTTVSGTDGKQATFAMPARVETVQKFTGAAKRTTARIDTTIATTWRYAPVGKIESVWQKAFVSDVSRSGCSLTTDKTIKVGNTLELKLPLKPNGGEVHLRAEAMRVDPMEATKKFSVGLRFAGGQADAEREVLAFINRRQTDLRGRGLG